MRDQILDLDLDYFNPWLDIKSGPLPVVDRLLHTLDPRTPCQFFIEHQDVLKALKPLGSKDFIDIPGTWFHVDHHHDFYNDRPKEEDDVGCWNFGFAIPVSLYDRFVWVTKYGSHAEEENAWEFMEEKNKTFEVRERWTWESDRVGVVYVTVSPDYSELAHYLNAIIHLIADYFGIDRVPLPVRKYGTQPSSWKFRKRVAPYKP